MARVDYKSLGFDAKIGRKARVCGRCNNLMAVTTICPKRANSDNKYVCWHCCWKCTYSVDTPQGKACGIKVNRKKAEREKQQKARAAKKEKKTKRQHDEDAEYSFFNEE